MYLLDTLPTGHLLLEWHQTTHQVVDGDDKNILIAYDAHKPKWQQRKAADFTSNNKSCLVVVLLIVSHNELRACIPCSLLSDNLVSFLE